MPIDATTRGALASPRRVLPGGVDPRLGWVVFEAIAEGLGVGLAAQRADIEAALTSWSIVLYPPNATTVACLATAIAHPVVVRAIRLTPSTHAVSE